MLLEFFLLASFQSESKQLSAVDKLRINLLPCSGLSRQEAREVASYLFSRNVVDGFVLQSILFAEEIEDKKLKKVTVPACMEVNIETFLSEVEVAKQHILNLRSKEAAGVCPLGIFLILLSKDKECHW